MLFLPFLNASHTFDNQIKLVIRILHETTQLTPGQLRVILLWLLLLLLVRLRFGGKSPIPVEQSPRLHPLELRVDLVAFERKLIRVLGCRPEVIDGKARVEVGAEVVHDPNREHDVHAKLEGDRVRYLAWAF